MNALARNTKRPNRFLIVALGLQLFLVAPTTQSHEDPSHHVLRVVEQLSLDSKNSELHIRKGDLLRMQGKWEAAEIAYDLAAKHGADPGITQVCMATLYLDQGKATEALATLQSAEALDWIALRLLGRAHGELGNHQDAAVSLAQSVGANPRPTPQDYLELAHTYTMQSPSNIINALETIDCGIELFGPIAPLVLAGVELEAARESFGSALRRLDATPATLRESPSWMTMRGDILEQEGRAMEAAAAYTEALAKLQNMPRHRQSTPANQDLKLKLTSCLRGFQ
jgi:predicted negative regulator of RcsB-dependent stress response